MSGRGESQPGRHSRSMQLYWIILEVELFLKLHRNKQRNSFAYKYFEMVCALPFMATIMVYNFTIDICLNIPDMLMLQLAMYPIISRFIAKFNLIRWK